MNSLDWNHFRHFLAVARHGSTIAASKALNVSQSTVHRHVTELEKSVGRHLVVRHATGYRLTELGADLQPFAQRVEEAVLAFERQVRASDEAPDGLVRLTCSESIGYRLLHSMLLDRLRDRHPRLHVELVMTDHFLDLSKGEADVAVRAGEPDDDTLVGRKIADVPWGVYASRSYVERHGRLASAEEINRHAVIGFDGDIKNHHAGRWLRAVAPRSTVAARSNTVTHPDLRRTPRIRAVFDYIIAEIESVRLALVGEAI
jgi:DNA-binding transcriptional LysR family regulator